MHKKIFYVCYFVIYLLISQAWGNFIYFKDTRSIYLLLFSGFKGWIISKSYCSLNSQYLWMWHYLEVESLQMKLNEIIMMDS